MAGLQLFVGIHVCFILMATGKCSKFDSPLPEKTLLEEQFGDWLMIFRAKSGNGQLVVTTYLTPGVASERDPGIPKGCVSIRQNAECTGHYRHSIIDRWESANIKKVKVEMYNGGLSVAHVIFDGRQTTSTNWFAKNRVLSSSWDDLQGSRFNVFGFFGHVHSNEPNVTYRRLMINHKYNSCPKDEGWMLVIERPGVCLFESIDMKYPRFLFSRDSTKEYVKDFNSAEVLAIYVML